MLVARNAHHRVVDFFDDTAAFLASCNVADTVAYFELNRFIVINNHKHSVQLVVFWQTQPANYRTSHHRSSPSGIQESP